MFHAKYIKKQEFLIITSLIIVTFALIVHQLMTINGMFIFFEKSLYTRFEKAHIGCWPQEAKAQARQGPHTSVQAGEDRLLGWVTVGDRKRSSETVRFRQSSRSQTALTP